MIKELQEKIEGLTQKRKDVEHIYRSEVAKIDMQLKTIKESLLETLSLLGSPSQLGLRKRLTVFFKPAVDCFKKDGWKALFYFACASALLYVMYYLVQHDFLNTNPDRNTAVVLTMTQAEYDLVRSAGRLVVRDLENFDSVGAALSAFYAVAPASVRDAVIARLGSAASLSDLPGAMDDVLGRVVVTGEPVAKSQETECRIEEKGERSKEEAYSNKQSEDDEQEPDENNVETDTTSNSLLHTPYALQHRRTFFRR